MPTKVLDSAMPWKKRMAIIEVGEDTEAVSIVRLAHRNIMDGKKYRGGMQCRERLEGIWPRTYLFLTYKLEGRLPKLLKKGRWGCTYPMVKQVLISLSWFP